MARYTRHDATKTPAGNLYLMSHLLRSFCAVVLATSLTAASNDHFPDDRDCVAVFDLFVAIAAPACAPAAQRYEQPDKIAAAIHLLVSQGFVQAKDFDNIRASFCPLSNGLGLTPSPDSVYLDDGLQQASVDTLAEVLFHELYHVRQMRELGAQSFKCAYIDSLIACNGCTDQRHALEAPAHEAQGLVRDALLNRWLKHNAAGQGPP